MGGGGRLISIHPEQLTFEVELDKPSYCNLKVVNNTEHHVAFKVKTTSPRKYFVRPNASVVQPWDSCTIKVTLQAQKEYSPDVQCKDKFLIQSTRVPPSIDIDEIPADTFNKDGIKVIEELKLGVVYTSPFGHANSEEDYGLTSSVARRSRQSSDDLMVFKSTNIEAMQTVQRLKEETDFTLRQNQQMQRELVHNHFFSSKSVSNIQSRFSFFLSFQVKSVLFNVGPYASVPCFLAYHGNDLEGK
ncbi:vesicle-associated protein 2-1-like isoform X2 [Typha latifolia]|uniref:vesicle-associated protein 2-1-like isoform X2 n=1 Tax=Typha latifolia TaxID=4733 RepID=UPI003C2F6B1F